MMKFSTKPSSGEILWGGIYLMLFTFVLPWLVPVAAYILAPGLNSAQVNFLYFSFNFIAAMGIFRKFLFRSLGDALQTPGAVLWYAVLAYLGSLALGNLAARLILRLDPEFSNVNDMAIQAMVGENFLLMAIGAVVLAPITEEILFRGLIFRSLYDRSPLAAHLISMALFSAVHISGYLATYEPKKLLLCFVQYLPAAYCLNFAYRRSGTIVAPMLTHALVNLVALFAMR